MATQTSRTHLARTRWQDNFLAVLPAIQQHAAICFRHHHDRKEAIAEATASAFIGYGILARRRRLSRAFPSALARFAVKAVIGGRHVGGRLNSLDVLCPYARGVSPGHPVFHYRGATLTTTTQASLSYGLPTIDFQRAARTWDHKRQPLHSKLCGVPLRPDILDARFHSREWAVVNRLNGAMTDFAFARWCGRSANHPSAFSMKDAANSSFQQPALPVVLPDSTPLGSGGTSHPASGISTAIWKHLFCRQRACVASITCAEFCLETCNLRQALLTLKPLLPTLRRHP